ncbi:MAG: hypothetical protein HYV63_32155, partial [Candidatus Schekmanbacteria bacterium]|nr:hypothetical protein [Candidatus Schekmanbacteria bacterium]
MNEREVEGSAVTSPLTQVSGVIVAGFGVSALSGWFADLDLLTTFGQGYIPMAPSTALVFLLFGGALALHSALPHRRAARWASTASGIMATAAAVTLLPLSLLDRRPVLEHL